MQKVGLRLPIDKHAAALSIGGAKCEMAGPLWINFPFNFCNLEEWADAAYYFAKAHNKAFDSMQPAVRFDYPAQLRRFE